MAFEINFNNPTDGGTAFLASYLGAKKKADAETARLKAQQRQRMADTIGGAIGNVGGSFGRGWSEGVVNRYRMQDQMQLEERRQAAQEGAQIRRDQRSFDYDKQLTKYRSDLNRDDRFYDNFQMSPDDAESLGQREWESAPPQVRGQIASSLGLDPEQADTLFAGDGPEAKALRRQTAITLIRMREQGAKVQQAEEIAKVRRQQAYLAEQDNQRMQRVEGWKSQQYRVNDSKIEGSLRTNQTAIDSAAMDGNWSDQEIAAAQARQDRDVSRYLDKMEPVKKPPKTRQEAIEAGVAMDIGNGGTAFLNPKSGQYDPSYPPKQDVPEVTVQPPPPTPIAAPDGSKWTWDGKAYKEYTPKETPEQKREAEKNKKLTDFVASLAKEMVTESDALGVKKTQRPLTDDERREKIRQFKAGLEEINDDSEQGPTAPNTKVDAQGFSPVDRLRNAIDSGLPPGQIDDFVNAVMPSMAAEQVGQVKKYGRDYYNFKRRTKQAPQQQAAPTSQPSAQSNPLQEIQAMIGQYGPDKSKWPPDALERAMRIKHAMSNAAGK